MAELADALDLGSSGRPWGFKSLCPHQSKDSVRMNWVFILCVNNIDGGTWTSALNKTPLNGCFVVPGVIGAKRNEEKRAGASPFVRTKIKLSSKELSFILYEIFLLQNFYILLIKF